MWNHGECDHRPGEHDHAVMLPRELVVFGGATRSILATSDLPVLLSGWTDGASHPLAPSNGRKIRQLPSFQHSGECPL
jgi:hypothetical protein